MRRLLRLVGRGVFLKAITEYSEELGFDVIEVNPAYTSKGCECGFTGDAARPSRKMFRCPSCGRTGHADVHGAVMIEGRRSVPGLHRKLGSTAFTGNKEHAQRHQAHLTVEHLRSCGEHWEKHPSAQPRSRAPGRAALSGDRVH